jgi:hypothetical protein
MERLSPLVGQTVRRLSAIIRQVIVGEFCGRIMCMLWIGELDENFALSLSVISARTRSAFVAKESRSPARIKCGQAFSGSRSS